MAMSRVSKRLPLVGVIGGEDQSGCARLVGRELIKNNCIVLTGGCPTGNENKTKNAALLGALDAEQHKEGIARFIGIMPENGKPTFSIECLTPRQLIIHTGLSSLDRDPINGTTPDALICFDGGSGTICELAFGIAVGHEAIFHDNCARNLLDQCTKSKRIEIKQILSRIAEKWKTHLPLIDDSGNTIMNMLIDYLRKAVDRVPLTSATEIVQATLKILPDPLCDMPVFPGTLDLHYKKQQQQEFAARWATLLNDAV